MDAQLVGAPGSRLELEPGDRRVAPLAPAPDAPKCPRRVAFRIDLHPPAALLVEPAEPQVDRAALLGGRANDDRPIGLGDLALLEQEPQFLQSLVMSSEHETTGRLAIEPMGERWLSRQAEAQRFEIVLEAGAALRPAMHGDAGRLVEDEHQSVAVEQPRSCFFGRHGDIGYREEPRPQRAGDKDDVLSEDAEKTAKPSLMRRWFGGRGAAPPQPAAPEQAPAPILEASRPEPAESAPAPAPEPKRTWFQRLKAGLTLSSNSIGRGVTDIFTRRKLDADALDDLEDVLIQADLGLNAATRIREAIGRGRYEKGITPEEVKAVLAAEVERTLAPVARPLEVDASKRPFVILVVGVNGSGKTTTIGKLAAQFRAEGKTIVLAAGDTFRAAAIEQLRVWARRTFSDLVERDQGADAAGLAFDALTRARELDADVMLMDTAGRLQNRAELMGELEKIIRVLKKVDAEAPHATLLVLDATVGQNALNQVEIFRRTAGVTGLVMTKLDGTARGGILVAIADKFALPVHFIGVGESLEDLEPFAARDFAAAIAGIERAEAPQ